KIQRATDARFGHADRKVFITSGTSGGLMLALAVLVNPGDEVIVFDPWFVMYKHLTTLAGGKVGEIDTYPDFRIDVDRVRAAITPRTKVILCNSPANPTGAVASANELEASRSWQPRRTWPSSATKSTGHIVTTAPSRARRCGTNRRSSLTASA